MDDVTPLVESAPPLPDKPGANNWIEHDGNHGLPSYIDRIARHLHHEKGMPVGRAIAIAVNVVKRMCASGDLNFKGKQSANAGSRAEACAAVAQWEKMKARSHAQEGAALVDVGHVEALVAEAWWFGERAEIGDLREAALVRAVGASSVPKGLSWSAAFALAEAAVDADVEDRRRLVEAEVQAVLRGVDAGLSLVEAASLGLRGRGGDALSVGGGLRGRGGGALKVWDESWVIRNRIGQFAEWVKRIPPGGVGRLGRAGATVRKERDGSLTVVDGAGNVVASRVARLEDAAVAADKAREADLARGPAGPERKPAPAPEDASGDGFMVQIGSADWRYASAEEMPAIREREKAGTPVRVKPYVPKFGGQAGGSAEMSAKAPAGAVVREPVDLDSLGRGKKTERGLFAVDGGEPQFGYIEVSPEAKDAWDGSKFVRGELPRTVKFVSLSGHSAPVPVEIERAERVSARVGFVSDGDFQAAMGDPWERREREVRRRELGGGAYVLFDSTPGGKPRAALYVSAPGKKKDLRLGAVQTNWRGEGALASIDGMLANHKRAQGDGGVSVGSSSPTGMPYWTVRSLVVDRDTGRRMSITSETTARSASEAKEKVGKAIDAHPALGAYQVVSAVPSMDFVADPDQPSLPGPEQESLFDGSHEKPWARLGIGAAAGWVPVDKHLFGTIEEGDRVRIGREVGSGARSMLADDAREGVVVGKRVAASGYDEFELKLEDGRSVWVDTNRMSMEFLRPKPGERGMRLIDVGELATEIESGNRSAADRAMLVGLQVMTHPKYNPRTGGTYGVDIDRAGLDKVYAEIADAEAEAMSDEQLETWLPLLSSYGSLSDSDASKVDGQFGYGSYSPVPAMLKAVRQKREERQAKSAGGFVTQKPIVRALRAGEVPAGDSGRRVDSEKLKGGAKKVADAIDALGVGESGEFDGVSVKRVDGPDGGAFEVVHGDFRGRALSAKVAADLVANLKERKARSSRAVSTADEPARSEPSMPAHDDASMNAWMAYLTARLSAMSRRDRNEVALALDDKHSEGTLRELGLLPEMFGTGTATALDALRPALLAAAQSDDEREVRKRAGAAAVSRRVRGRERDMGVSGRDRFLRQQDEFRSGLLNPKDASTPGGRRPFDDPPAADGAGALRLSSVQRSRVKFKWGLPDSDDVERALDAAERVQAARGGLPVDAMMAAAPNFPGGARKAKMVAREVGYEMEALRASQGPDLGHPRLVVDGDTLRFHETASEWEVRVAPVDSPFYRALTGQGPVVAPDEDGGFGGFPQYPAMGKMRVTPSGHVEWYYPDKRKPEKLGMATDPWWVRATGGYGADRVFAQSVDGEAHRAEGRARRARQEALKAAADAMPAPDPSETDESVWLAYQTAQLAGMRRARRDSLFRDLKRGQSSFVRVGLLPQGTGVKAAWATLRAAFVAAAEDDDERAIRGGKGGGRPLGG